MPIDRSKTKHSFGQPTSKTRSEGELCVLLTAQEITEQIKNQSPRPDSAKVSCQSRPHKPGTTKGTRS